MVKLSQTTQNKPLRIQKKPEQRVKLKIVSHNLDSIKGLHGEELLSKIESMEFTENTLKTLYTEEQDILNEYVDFKWSNKLEGQVKVVSYNNIQEFYFLKDYTDELLEDKILSYSIIPSNFMYDYMKDELVRREGFMITRDLPEESYDKLLQGCSFSLYEAEE